MAINSRVTITFSNDQPYDFQCTIDGVDIPDLRSLHLKAGVEHYTTCVVTKFMRDSHNQLVGREVDGEQYLQEITFDLFDYLAQYETPRKDEPPCQPNKPI